MISRSLFAALVAALVGGGSVCAADYPTPPMYAANPTLIGGVPSIGESGGCASCQGAPAAGGCSVCGCKKHAKPYFTQLRPGTCFGYFQTQWHRWENVCPIPYQGTGLDDSPRPGGVPPATPGATNPGAMPQSPTTPSPMPKGKFSSDDPLPLPKPANIPGPGVSPLPMPMIPSTPGK